MHRAVFVLASSSEFTIPLFFQFIFDATIAVAPEGKYEIKLKLGLSPRSAIRRLMYVLYIYLRYYAKSMKKILSTGINE